MVISIHVTSLWVLLYSEGKEILLGYMNLARLVLIIILVYFIYLLKKKFTGKPYAMLQVQQSYTSRVVGAHSGICTTMKSLCDVLLVAICFPSVSCTRM
jgi:hypothetical protein